MDTIMDQIVKEIIKKALEEDLGNGDITTEATIPNDKSATGEFLVKGDGVITGLTVAAEVFKQVDKEVKFELLFTDGDQAKKGDIVARVSGKARSLLVAERTALNFLQRMSGIATATRECVDAIAHTKAKILDTRKTAPGLRLLDKMAVRIGGGENHRMGLFDMFLVKENHIAVAGSIAKAVAACLAYKKANNLDAKIEVETENLDQVEEAVASGVDWVMFDNFNVSEMKKAVELVHGRVKTEASGGMHVQNVKDIAETGVDYISVGALTHSVKALDISFDIAL
ncbi:MAG: carboxylating nicotinate-nucleotide diphosphorylase [Candidatus Levybacteria bacterium]|nr:carboxylating nicotinate-nucleotide diphosphorylase [Candidatus Levybacteria bacterium]